MRCYMGVMNSGIILQMMRSVGHVEKNLGKMKSKASFRHERILNNDVMAIR